MCGCVGVRKYERECECVYVCVCACMQGCTCICVGCDLLMYVHTCRWMHILDCDVYVRCVFALHVTWESLHLSLTVGCLERETSSTDHLQTSPSPGATS